jgi:hypothetical protein
MSDITTTAPDNYEKALFWQEFHAYWEKLAEKYTDSDINVDEWGPAHSVTHPGRRQVTLSVRFSEEEIAAVRTAAHQAGVKPTAFIRARVLP